MNMSMPASRGGRIAVWLIVALLVIGFIGAVVLPPIAKHYALKIISEQIGRQVSIESVSINPYALSVTVTGVSIKEEGGASDFVSFRELFVNTEFRSILKGGIVVKEIRLVEPKIRFARLTEDRYSFSDILERIKAKAKPEPPDKKPSEPAKFAIHNIELKGGHVEFEDRPKAKKHVVSAINVGVPFLSNLPVDIETFVEPSFSANVNGAVVALGGKSRLFTETRGGEVHLEAKDISIPPYLAYVPAELPVAVRSALLDLNVRVKFEQPKDKPAAVTLAGSVALRDLDVTEPSGTPVMKLARLSVDLDRVDPFAPSVDLKKVSVEKPEVHVARLGDNRIMPAALFEKKPAKADEPAAVEPGKAAKPVSYSVAEVALMDGVVHFTDETVSPRLETRLENIGISVKDISSKPNSIMSAEFSAVTASGEKLGATSAVGISPLFAEGRIDLAGLKPAVYNAYVTPHVKAELTRGTVDFSTGFKVETEGEKQRISLSNLQAAIADFGLRKEGEKGEFFTLGRFEASGGTLDLSDRSFSLENLLLKSTKLVTRREADGHLDLADLPRKPAEEKPVPSTQAGAAPAARKPAKADAEKPWLVTLKNIRLEGIVLDTVNMALSEPGMFLVDLKSLTAENVSTVPGTRARFRISALFNRKGQFTSSGTAVVRPLAVEAKVDLKGLELLPFQPYVTDFLNISVTKGALNFSGVATFAMPPDGPVQAGFKGGAEVADFHSVDKVNVDDFLVWKSLAFQGIDFSLSPLMVVVDEIAFKDLYSRLIINPDGIPNIRKILKTSETPATVIPEGETGAKTAPVPAQAAAPPEAEQSAAAPPVTAQAGPAGEEKPGPDIRIGRISFQRTNINFTDNFIRPNYTVNMTDLDGYVSGLLSWEGTAADIELLGSVDHTAPLVIRGKINPLLKDRFVDMILSIKGMEMSLFTPYSSRYLGYGIEKGKLSLDVAYKIEGKKIDAQNRLFLDQLTFGEKVESPDATTLPVRFAISLLKNRKGEIDVNLPISGSLDDPEFSVGGIILKVILNIIVKAVTAPFTLLGSLFGSGEELSFVEFDPGRVDLSDETLKRLDVLARALDDRPGLHMDVAGRADPFTDAGGLKKLEVERQLKVLKFNDLTKKGEAPESAEKVDITPDDYPVYVEKAFKASKLPRPKDDKGKTRKEVPPEELEKLMVENTVLPPDALLALANRRAQVVKDQLVGVGKVAAERVFVVSSRTDTEPPKDGGKASRVDFTLK